MIKKPEHKGEQKTAGHPASQVKHDHDTPYERPKTQSAALAEQLAQAAREDKQQHLQTAAVATDAAVAKAATVAGQKAVDPPMKATREAIVKVEPKPTLQEPTFGAVNALAEALAKECATHEGRKAFYAGDGVARATALRDQALALAARFGAFVRA